MYEKLDKKSHDIGKKEVKSQDNEEKSLQVEAEETLDNTIEKIDKIKNKAIEELDDFIDDSASKLNDSGRFLKKSGLKYFDMAKREIGESQKYLQQNIPVAAKRLKEEMDKNGKSIQNGISKGNTQNKKHVTGFVERLYGASTVGKQYGPQSIKLLREIAGLRQEGLITDSEYRAKKKELLRRI